MGANPTAARYLPVRPLVPLGRLRRVASEPLFLLPDGPLENGNPEAAEPVYLNDDNPALTSAPAEPLGPSAGKAVRHGKWHAAIVASLVVHAAVIWFFVDQSRDDLLVEGAENVGLTMRGGATAQSAADEDDVTRVTLIDMVAARPVVTSTTEAVAVVDTAAAVPVEVAEPVADASASETVLAETPPVATPVEPSTMVPEAVQATPYEQPAEILVEAPPPAPEAAVAEVPTVSIPVEASTALPETVQTTHQEQMFEALPETTVAEVPPVALPAEASIVRSEMEPAQERLLEALPETAVAEVLPAVMSLEAQSVPADAALVSAPEQSVEAVAASLVPVDEPASEAISAPSEMPEILAVDHAAAVNEATEGLLFVQAVDVTDVANADAVATVEVVPTETVDVVSEAPEPAAVANYPGDVTSKLRLALRYPIEAAGRLLKGEVHVAFTISAEGNVSQIYVARSSGSHVLDMAAVETVRRVAPFPAIPAEAARSSWPLTVALVFTRLSR